MGERAVLERVEQNRRHQVTVAHGWVSMGANASVPPARPGVPASGQVETVLPCWVRHHHPETAGAHGAAALVSARACSEAVGASARLASVVSCQALQAASDRVQTEKACSAVGGMALPACRQGSRQPAASRHEAAEGRASGATSSEAVLLQLTSGTSNCKHTTHTTHV
jgi:hypothetical protein